MSKVKWAREAPRLSRLTIDDNKVKEFQKLNRADARIAIQIVHAALKHHLHRMKLENSPTCPKCGDEGETIEHFMGVCPYYAQLRGQVFNSYYLSISEICRHHSLKQILKFARDSKRFCTPNNTNDTNQPTVNSAS